MKATNTKNNRRSTEYLLIIVYAAPSNRVHRTSASVLRKHLTKSSKLICMLTFDIKWRKVFRHTSMLRGYEDSNERHNYWLLIGRWRLRQRIPFHWTASLLSS